MTALAFAVMLAHGASGQIPKTLNYQGVLTDGSGVAVSDGSYDLTFALYDVPSEGSALWTETQSVTVSKGIFSVILGSDTPIDLEFDDTYYLGISVEGGDELLPRIELSASAYAMSARGVTGDSNIFPPDGAVGIGTTLPSFKLHVVDDNPLPARVDGGDDTWAGLYINALQATATPMIGYERQSILHAYSYLDHNENWGLRVGGNNALTATSDGELGVGTSSPLEKLDVTGAVRLGNTPTNNAGTIRWTGSDFEGYDGADWKSLTGDGAEVLPSGTQGQTLRNTGSGWAAVSNLFNTGNYVGIGTTSPETKLHVSGGQWDLDGTEGDFKIGDGTYRLKIGVATGGGGAGTAGIRVQGGAEKLILGAGSSEVLSMESDGTVSVGSPAVQGNLDLYGTAGSGPLIELGSNSHGGNTYFRDEAGNTTAYIIADSDGVGGSMAIYRDIGSTGIYMAGNYAGSNDSYASISGSARTATFDMRMEGNSSVNLPVDAIGSSEILEEAGCASYLLAGGISLSSTPTTIASRSIAAPSSGYVLVIGTCQGQTYHNIGTASSAQFGVSNASGTMPSAQDALYYVHAGMPTGWFDRVVTVHGLFPVTEGTNTFYLLGRELSNDFTCYNTSLTLVYIPTAYGTVTEPTTLASSGAEEHPGTVSRSALTAQDIAAEQAECERLNEERIRRELGEMRSRIDDLQRELDRERR